MRHPKDSDRLTVIARAPFKVYFEGTAQVVSASNRIGDFDILPGHADFFSRLDPGEVVIEPDEGEPVTFRISNGIVTVRDDEVMMFVNM
jgi:F-type H+-transporting ATPase subunit epsilon